MTRILVAAIVGAIVGCSGCKAFEAGAKPAENAAVSCAETTAAHQMATVGLPTIMSVLADANWQAELKMIGDKIGADALVCALQALDIGLHAALGDSPDALSVLNRVHEALGLTPVAPASPAVTPLHVDGGSAI